MGAIALGKFSLKEKKTKVRQKHLEMARVNHYVLRSYDPIRSNVTRHRSLYVGNPKGAFTLSTNKASYMAETYDTYMIS